jgi:hypothetical protein
LEEGYMTETQLYHKLQTKLKPKPIKLKRIETGGTALGIPDILFTGKDLGGFIELKQLPRRELTIKPDWRPGQLSTGKDLVEARINLWLLIYFNKQNEFALVPGKYWKESFSSELLYLSKYMHLLTFNIKPTILYRILMRDQY